MICEICQKTAKASNRARGRQWEMESRQGLALHDEDLHLHYQDDREHARAQILIINGRQSQIHSSGQQSEFLNGPILWPHNYRPQPRRQNLL